MMTFKCSRVIQKCTAYLLIALSSGWTRACNVEDHILFQSWWNHPGKSGRDLTNILTLDTGLAKLANYMFLL